MRARALCQPSNRQTVKQLSHHDDPNLPIEAALSGRHSRRRDPDATVDAHVDLVNARAHGDEQLPRIATAANKGHRLPVREITHYLDGLDATDARGDSLNLGSRGTELERLDE